MNHAAAYPFSDKAGLCVVLRDPNLWAEVFYYDAARKSLKRAAKRVFRLTVLRVSDELALGERCVALLSTARGREALAKERREFASVGSLLLSEVARTYGEIFSEDAKFAFFDDGNWRLDFERFEQWFKQRDWGDEEIVSLALFACGFAMQTPEIADDLFALIVDHEPRVHPLLIDDAVVVESADAKESTTVSSGLADVERQDEIETDADADAQFFEPTASEHAASAVAPEVESTSDAERPATGQTVEQWRESLAALKRRIADEEARLALLDQTAEAVGHAVAEVGRLPCLREPLQFGDVAKIGSTADGDAELARLTDAGVLLGTVLRSHSQLAVLMQRLRLPIKPWLPGGHADLPLLAAQLEERTATLSQQVELLNRTMTRGMEFLDQVATADVATAVTLVSEATPDLWLSLARLLFDAAYETEATSARRAALGLPEIAGLILAQAWQREEASAMTIAERLFSNVSGRWSLRDFAFVLAPLNFGQMQVLADTRPEWAHLVTTLVFLCAMRRDRAELLDYLEPLLHTDVLDHACRDFFRAMSDARHRGKISSLALEVRRALVNEPAAEDSGEAVEGARQRLLELARESPGMEGIYRRLRIFAQRLYLEPLAETIERGDVRGAVSQWMAFGDLEDMASTAIRSSGEERKVDKPHREQTRRYLEHFADELQRWERMGAAAAQPRRAEFAPAVSALRDAKSEAARTLLDAIELPDTEDFPSEDFGERGGPDGIQRVSAQGAGARIRPTMLASWPLAPAGEVPLAALLADMLREHVVEGGIPLQHAIKAYVQTGFYDAARRAAAGDALLQTFIEDTLAGRRDALKREHLEIWSEAQNARGIDRDLDECMVEIEIMLDHDDFANAAGLYDLLSDLLIEFRRKSDPERQALCAFLAEGGEEGAPTATAAELEAQMRSMREANDVRRQHLAALRDSAANPQAPDPLRTAWSAAAQRLDRPSLWPTPARSSALATALAKLLPWMCGKWQFRSGDADPITAIVQRVSEWVPAQLLADLQTSEPSSPPSTVVRLADLVAAYCPDAAVLRHIGEAPTQSVTPQAPVPKTSAPALVVSDLGEIVKPPVSEAVPTMQRHGAQIREYMEIEEPESEADFPKLREAGRQGDWMRVRRLAATLACSDRGQEDSVQQDLQALYGIGFLQTESDFNDALLQDACVAVIASPRADYYVGAAITAELPTRAVLLGLRVAEAGAPTVEQLGQALSAVGEAAPSADNFQWFAELLRKAHNVIIAPEKGTRASAKLARHLWEQFKNLSRNEEYRSRLLRLLFRNHQQEALRELAELSPLKDLIQTCLRAFDAAESDPEARAAALQLSAALRGQAQRKPNTQPWILLFHSLESARAAVDHVALHYELDSDFVNEEADGSLSIELRIKPSLFDPPQRLSITLGNLPPRLIVEEALFTERSVSVPLVASLVPSAGSECQLAYRIEGMTTTQKRPIDMRGTWHLHRGQTTAALDEVSINRAWPGATRNPVKRNWGFFGRQDEIRRIESYIHGPARIGSVMVFGERRIGKTSVLKEIISTMPPERGRVCGAFCDLSGLQFSGEAGTIPDAFFQRLVTHLDLPTENGTIADALAKHRGHPVKVERLARNLTPSISLYGALETLAQRLDEESGGVISKVAFFIDEFDRFVEPLVRARRDEVNNFMWELRQVIQRSERISLILAGSGLQRLLKENYQDALFGSIDEVTLPRFSWEKDRDAITNTFLPETVRAQLCRGEEVPRLAQYAAEICGGHPMFLALLGSSAAQMARGRFLTPGFLDRVVANVVQAEPGRTRLNVERKFFYQFVFESLGILDPREYALARGLFATLARVTTWEKAFAWFPVSRVIEVSGLLQYTNNQTRPLLTALDRLGKADAILNDKAAGQVRISVPITAAAVREDEGAIRAEVEHMLQTLDG